MATALIGRDQWRFGTVSVLAGVVLLGLGGWLNREYLRELFSFRGASRRGEKRAAPRTATAASKRMADAGTVRPPVVPGLADSPVPRAAGGLRGDREAPIMTATDGIGRQGNSIDDTPPDGPPRVRIR